MIEARIAQLIELEAKGLDYYYQDEDEVLFGDDDDETENNYGNRLFNEASLKSVSKELEESIIKCVHELISLTERENDSSLVVPPRSSEKEITLQTKIDECVIQSRAVNDLWVLRAGIQEVDALVELNELAQALSSLDTVVAKLEVFGDTYNSTSLEKDIRRHVSNTTTNIYNRVDEGWEKAIVFSDEKGEDGGIISNSLTVNQIVGDDLSLQIIYEAVQVIDSRSLKATSPSDTATEVISSTPNSAGGIRKNRLEILLKSLERQIFDPILGLNASVSSAEIVNNGNTVRYLREHEGSISSYSVKQLLNILQTTVGFLQRVFEPPLLSILIAKRFSWPVVQQLCSRTLPALFPSDPSQLKDFRAQLRSVVEFENFLAEGVKWVATSDLSHWVDDFANEWVIYRKAYYLDALRDTLIKDIKLIRSNSAGISIDSASAPLANSDNTPAESEWNWNEEEEQEEENPQQQEDHREENKKEDTNKNIDPSLGHGQKSLTFKPEDDEEDVDESWGWGEEDGADVEADTDSDFAKVKSTVNMPRSLSPSPTYSQSVDDIQNSLTTSTITSTVEKISHLVSSFMAEIHGQSSNPAHHVSDILALYRALSPIIYDDRDVVPSPLIAYNDFTTLAGLFESDSEIDISQDDIDQLKQLADRQLALILEESQTRILSYLSTANQFENCTGENQENCELAISNVMAFMRGVAHEWMKYASYPVAVQLLGSVLETAVTAIIAAIESNSDIAETESVQLSNIIQTVTTLEDIFDTSQIQRQENQSFAALHVPSWIKFQYLNEILQSKLVDITFLHSNNALVDFTSDELVSLVKALFAESEYRRRAIDEILGQ